MKGLSSSMFANTTSLAQRMFQLIRCNDCHTGTLVGRQGRSGRFYGCSNYPLCKHVEHGCSSCGQPMQRLGRFKVCIDPACADWVPVCPDCGGEMTQRSGRYGDFWGCRNYRREEAVSCQHTEHRIVFG